MKAISSLQKFYTPIFNEFILFIFTWFFAIIEPLRHIHGLFYIPLSDLKLTDTIYSILFLSTPIIFSYILALIAYLSKKKWIKFFCYLIPFTLFITNIFLELNFGVVLNPRYILIMCETNIKETTDFFSTYLLNKNGIIISFIVFICLFTILLLEKYWKDKLIQGKLKFLYKPIKIIFTPFFIISLFSVFFYIDLFQVQNTKELDGVSLKYTQSQDAYSRLLFSSFATIAMKKEIKHAIDESLNAYNSSVTSTADSLNVIFIIGESFIKSHSSLYGYYLPTNPRLVSEKKTENVFVYNNVNAPYNTTSQAVKNILSTNSLGLDEEWYSGIYFPILFRKAGFNVYFWDNQNVNSSGSVEFTLNSFLHYPMIDSLAYTKTNKSLFPFDGDLVKDYVSQGFSTQVNNLIVFHLWGQHVAVKSRYPDIEKWNHFNKDSITINKDWLTPTMRQEIAEYDNATLYNDWVVGSIINHFRNSNAVLIYLSDHGEEIYDWRPRRGRYSTQMSKNVLSYQYQIPFMVWCSDKYKLQNPDVVKDLAGSVDKPMSSDIVSHMLFHLSGLKTKFYRPQLDILSPNYSCPPRLIEDKYNFDSIMYKNK